MDPIWKDAMARLLQIENVIGSDEVGSCYVVIPVAAVVDAPPKGKISLGSSSLPFDPCKALKGIISEEDTMEQDFGA